VDSKVVASEGRQRRLWSNDFYFTVMPRLGVASPCFAFSLRLE